ncbi:MAG TPA: lysine--tRNA ligase [Euryarchaeota archaeon]|nr:lysine--tRNA ligase [Euryarchaeota archaeon]
MVHWAEEVARDLLKISNNHVISTGISPSGVFHVGHLREILTGDAIFRSVKRLGGNARFIFLVDDADPLRKVPAGIDKSFEEYIGVPIWQVPSPDGSSKSWAEYFLEPFLDALRDLGANPEVIRTSQIYVEGKFTDLVKIALENRDKIRSIIVEVTGRELPERWYPYLPQCKSCKRIDKTEVTGFDGYKIYYRCNACGHEGSVDIRGWGGKMPWRVEWPAKWKLFGVTCEPFGKDHAAAGGSYDTGSRILKEVFGGEPPYPVPYEWFVLKGAGTMSSSLGIVVSAKSFVKSVIPQVVRFLYVKYLPMTHVEFDPVWGTLNMFDEYQKYERVYFGLEEPTHGMKDVEYIYWLSQPSGKVPEKIPIQLPYRHAVVLVQIAKDFEGFLEILKRQYDPKEVDENVECLKLIYERAKNWVREFAPERAKFTLLEKLPEEIKQKLSEKIKEFLNKLLSKISSPDFNWDATNIHTTIHNTAKECGLNHRDAFGAIYLIFLGKSEGPRAGYFLYSLGKEFVVQRIGEALD